MARIPERDWSVCLSFQDNEWCNSLSQARCWLRSESSLTFVTLQCGYEGPYFTDENTEASEVPGQSHPADEQNSAQV